MADIALNEKVQFSGKEDGNSSRVSSGRYHELTLRYEFFKKIFDATAVVTTATVVFNVVYALATKEPALAPTCLMIPEMVALGTIDTLRGATGMLLQEASEAKK